jgi:hypothetical protein
VSLPEDASFLPLVNVCTLAVRAVRPKTSKIDRALQVWAELKHTRSTLRRPGDFRIEPVRPGCRYSDLTNALVWCLLAARQHIAARREDQHWEQELQGFSLFG